MRKNNGSEYIHNQEKFTKKINKKVSHTQIIIEISFT